ncbi:MAG TPA: hypothetical protein VHI77_07045 [Solirubrobacterales bacterium]|jgi:hypothetical protein|nr:hypothetical protein [Solirubrobacterales bacterium]
MFSASNAASAVVIGTAQINPIEPTKLATMRSGVGEHEGVDDG